MFLFSVSFSVLPRANVCELSHGAAGEFDLPVLWSDRVPEAALLQDHRGL